MFEVISPYLEPIILTVIVTIGGAIIKYFRDFIKEQKENSKRIDELCKRLWRTQKALIIFAKLVEEQSEKSHPEVKSDLDALVSEILKNDVNGK